MRIYCTNEQAHELLEGLYGPCEFSDEACIKANVIVSSWLTLGETTCTCCTCARCRAIQEATAMLIHDLTRYEDNSEDAYNARRSAYTMLLNAGAISRRVSYGAELRGSHCCRGC